MNGRCKFHHFVRGPIPTVGDLCIFYAYVLNLASSESWLSLTKSSRFPAWTHAFCAAASAAHQIVGILGPDLNLHPCSGFSTTMERLQAVVVASILFFQLGGANTVNLPLYTRSVGNGGGIDVVREIAHVRRRYGQNTPHTGKRAVESIPIVNQVRRPLLSYHDAYLMRTEL